MGYKFNQKCNLVRYHSYWRPMWKLKDCYFSNKTEDDIMVCVLEKKILEIGVNKDPPSILYNIFSNASGNSLKNRLKGLFSNNPELKAILLKRLTENKSLCCFEQEIKNLNWSNKRGFENQMLNLINYLDPSKKLQKIPYNQLVVE